ncbi:MAG TPA: YqaA family protein [Dongiaceae bacterium]|jgi:membrane protein YqaA with SNARE-associated domain|nr:YqaA family protein [Dongiaceae bacterium]
MPSRLFTARARMLRRLYDRIIALSSHPHALAWLALLAVAESSVFPLAPDILIIPMAIARPRQAWLIALVATIGSIIGGLLGYAIGHFLFKAIGQPIVDFYGLQPLLDEFRRLYQRWGVLIIAAGGFTPIPYKVIAIASGIAGLDPLIFILASTASRGSRFFLEAALLSRYGEPLRRFIASHLVIFATLVLLLLLGALLLLRYL